MANNKSVKRNRFGIVILLVLALSASGGMAGTQSETDIKLVLQITVDGLRGDLINRYEAGFGHGGL